MELKLHDSHLISFFKAISWRTLGTITTFLISYELTGNYKIALATGTLDAILKIGLYYFHERCWIYLGNKSAPKMLIKS
jgi:uncharacterized membrane protein